MDIHVWKLFVDDKVGKLCSRGIGRISSLIDTNAERRTRDIDGRAWHIVPDMTTSTCAGKELVALAFKLQDAVGIISLVVGELRAPLGREDGEHITTVVEREDPILIIGFLVAYQ